MKPDEEIIKKIADEYKKETGHHNVIGDVASELKRLWPFISRYMKEHKMISEGTLECFADSDQSYCALRIDGEAVGAVKNSLGLLPGQSIKIALVKIEAPTLPQQPPLQKT